MKKTLAFVIYIVSFIAMLLSAGTSFALDGEQMTLKNARQMFEKKQFAEAIKEYDKIPQSSDRYFLAVEEKAWAHLHLDNIDKAIAGARTLTSPALSGLVGTEPYLLQAIAQLKICDYVAVFQTLKDFKNHKRTQVDAVQKISKNKRNELSQQVLTQWMENPEDWKKLGPYLSQMPQLFYRDKQMLKAAKAKNRDLLEKRLHELANIENNENYRILQKLNLIEIESIQRVHIATEFNRKQGETLVKGENDLVFEDTDEIWLDELDSYQATVNRCKQKSGRTM